MARGLLVGACGGTGTGSVPPASAPASGAPSDWQAGGGEAWETVWELPTWIAPFRPRDPRRIGNTARQVQGFVDALREGRAPGITGEDGRAAIEMTEAASRSAATGEAVRLPLGPTDAAG